MKRILGFLLGISIGLSIAYTIRRWISPPGETASGILSTPIAKAPDISTSETTEEKPIAIKGRYTVRTNGPRPQARVADEPSEPNNSTTETTSENNLQSPTDNVVAFKSEQIEPVAAQETDLTAVSSRAEIETQLETANSQEDLPKVIPPTNNSKDQEQANVVQDKLTLIRGIGEVTAQKLNAAGISSFTQLATMPLEQLEQITEFNEARIKRDKLIEQATALSNGETYEFPDEEVK